MVRKHTVRRGRGGNVESLRHMSAVDKIQYALTGDQPYTDTTAFVQLKGNENPSKEDYAKHLAELRRASRIYPLKDEDGPETFVNAKIYQKQNAKKNVRSAFYPGSIENSALFEDTRSIFEPLSVISTSLSKPMMYLTTQIENITGGKEMFTSRGEGFKRKNSWRFYVSFEDEEKLGLTIWLAVAHPALIRDEYKLKWADIAVDIDALKRGEIPSVLEDSILGQYKKACDKIMENPKSLRLPICAFQFPSTGVEFIPDVSVYKNDGWTKLHNKAFFSRYNQVPYLYGCVVKYVLPPRIQALSVELSRAPPDSKLLDIINPYTGAPFRRDPTNLGVFDPMCVRYFMVHYVSHKDGPHPIKKHHNIHTLVDKLYTQVVVCKAFRIGKHRFAQGDVLHIRYEFTKFLMIKRHFYRDLETHEPVCNAALALSIDEAELRCTTYQQDSLVAITNYTQPGLAFKLPNSSNYCLYDGQKKVSDFTGRAIEDELGGPVCIRYKDQPIPVLFRTQTPVSYSGYERHKVYEWIPDQEAYFIVYHGCNVKGKMQLTMTIRASEIAETEPLSDCKGFVDGFRGAVSYNYFNSNKLNKPCKDHTCGIDPDTNDIHEPAVVKICPVALKNLAYLPSIEGLTRTNAYAYYPIKSPYEWKDETQFPVCRYCFLPESRHIPTYVYGPTIRQIFNSDQRETFQKRVLGEVNKVPPVDGSHTLGHNSIAYSKPGTRSESHHGDTRKRTRSRSTSRRIRTNEEQSTNVPRMGSEPADSRVQKRTRSRSTSGRNSSESYLQTHKRRRHRTRSSSNRSKSVTRKRTRSSSTSGSVRQSKRTRHESASAVSYNQDQQEEQAEPDLQQTDSESKKVQLIAENAQEQVAMAKAKETAAEKEMKVALAEKAMAEKKADEAKELIENEIQKANENSEKKSQDADDATVKSAQLQKKAEEAAKRLEEVKQEAEEAQKKAAEARTHALLKQQEATTANELSKTLKDTLSK